MPWRCHRLSEMCGAAAPGAHPGPPSPSVAEKLTPDRRAMQRLGALVEPSGPGWCQEDNQVAETCVQSVRWHVDRHGHKGWSGRGETRGAQGKENRACKKGNSTQHQISPPANRARTMSTKHSPPELGIELQSLPRTPPPVALPPPPGPTHWFP